MIFDISLKFLDKNQKMDKILLKIYGFSFVNKDNSLAFLGFNKKINKHLKIKNCDEIYVKKLISYLSDKKIEEKLSNEDKLILKNIMSLKTYKALRFKLCLPVRGQRTKTNAQTQKRKKVLLASLNKKKNPNLIRKISINKNKKKK